MSIGWQHSRKEAFLEDSSTCLATCQEVSALALAIEQGGHDQPVASDLREYTRQVIVVDVHHAQTSCGFAVPRFDYVAERMALDNYCEKHLARQRAGRRAADL